MPGVKIKVSTEEAERAVNALRGDLSRLGTQAIATEGQVSKLQAGMVRGAGANVTANTALQKSLGLTNQQTNALTQNISRATVSFDYMRRGAHQLASAVSTTTKVVTGLIAAYTGFKLYAFIKDAANLAMRYETLGIVTKIVGKNAGYTAAEMDKFEQSMVKSGIAMVEARQTLAMMAQANLDLTQSAKLARIAQDAAVIGNINSSEAFERMIHGIVSGNTIILRNIGIQVDFDRAYQTAAKAIGKKSTALTEEQKVQIRANTVMERGQRIAGAYESAMGTAGKQLNSMKRYLDDFKVKMGEAFGPAITHLVFRASEVINDLQHRIQDPKVQETLAEYAKKLADIAEIIINKIPSGIDKTINGLSKLMSVWNSVPEGISKFGIFGALFFGRMFGPVPGLLFLYVSQSLHMLEQTQKAIERYGIQTKTEEDWFWGKGGIIGPEGPLRKKYPNPRYMFGLAQDKEKSIWQGAPNVFAHGQSFPETFRLGMPDFWTSIQPGLQKPKNWNERWGPTVAGLEDIEAEKKRYAEFIASLGGKGEEDEEAIKKADQKRVYLAKIKYDALLQESKRFFGTEAKMIDFNAELMKIRGDEDQKIAEFTYTEKKALLERWVLDQEKLIAEEAQTRSLEDQKMLSNKEWIANKLKELDGEVYDQKFSLENDYRLMLAQTDAERIRAARDYAEFLIDLRVAELDFEEKMGKSRADVVQERLTAERWRLALLKDKIEEPAVKADPTAWRETYRLIQDTIRAIKELEREIELMDPMKAFSQGFKETMREWGNTSQQMYAIAQTTAQSMQQAFSDFFFDVLTGKLKKFGDYVTSFLNSIARAMANMMAEQAAQSIMGSGGMGSGIIGIIGSGIAGLMGMSTPGSVEHSGGIGEGPQAMVRRADVDFAPRFHRGIGPDERVSILRKDEGVFTPGQMKALGNLNSQPVPIKVEIINQTKENIKVSKTETKYNPQEAVVTLWLDAFNRDSFGLRTMLGG